MSWQENLHEYIEFLKQKHDLTDEQVRAELFADKLPTEIFSSELTPLQAAVHYLHTHLGKDAKAIAGLLARSAQEVERLMDGGRDHGPLPTGGVALPADLFADRSLSASEHLVFALEDRGYTVADIAVMLAKSEQTIWTLHYRIQKKRGEQT